MYTYVHDDDGKDGAEVGLPAAQFDAAPHVWGAVGVRLRADGARVRT